MTTHTRTALVSLLAIALLAWFLRNANFAQVWMHVQSARGDMLLAGLGCVALTYLVRAIRWQCLLRPLGQTAFRNTFRTTMIGFAALALLPARAGDVLRPYMLARREGLRAPATFATVVMERVLDLVAVLGLLATYVWGMADAKSIPAHLMVPVKMSAAIAGLAALILLVLMWVLASHPERIGRLVFAAARVLPHRIADKLAQFATLFSGGFAAARRPGTLLLGLFWSFPLWMAIAGETWTVTRAFDIDMSFGGSFLLQALLVIGVAVPTPGAVGGYHEAYRLGVTNFFGASEDAAVAAAIVVWAISYLPVVLVGVLFMIQDGLSVGQLQELAGEARDKELPHSDEMSILRSPGR